MNAFGKRNGLGAGQRPSFGVARPMKGGAGGGDSAIDSGIGDGGYSGSTSCTGGWADLYLSIVGAPDAGPAVVSVVRSDGAGGPWIACSGALEDGVLTVVLPRAGR